MVENTVIVCYKYVYYSEVNNRRSFPFVFLCANVLLAYLLNGNVVILQYLCSKATFSRMSSLRSIGAGKLWLQAGLVSKGVSCPLNSVLIPISNQSRVKMTCNSTDSVSTACLAAGSNVESVQSKLYKMVSGVYVL